MSLILRPGDRSNNVVGLQHALNAAIDDEPPLVLDGINGPNTQRAVRIIQRRRSLTLDGVAGPQTLDELFELITITSRVEIERTGHAPPRERTLASPLHPPFAVPRPRDGRSDVSLGAAGLRLLEPEEIELKLWRWEGSNFPKPIFLYDFPRLQLDPRPVIAAMLREEGIPIIREKVPNSAASGGSLSRPLPKWAKGFGFELELGGSAEFGPTLNQVNFIKSIRLYAPKTGKHFQNSYSLINENGSWRATLQNDYHPAGVKFSQGPFSLDWKFGLSTYYIFENLGAKTTYGKGKVNINTKVEGRFAVDVGPGEFQFFARLYGGAYTCFQMKDGVLSQKCLNGGNGIAPDIGVGGGVRYIFGAGKKK